MPRSEEHRQLKIAELASARVRTRLSRKEHSTGFSLAELIVVVAIILLIAALAIPQVVKVVVSERLQGTAGSLAGLIQSARMLAAKKNATCEIVTGSPAGVTGAFVDPTGTGTYASGDYLVQFGTNVNLASSGSAPATWTPTGDTAANVLPDTAVLGFGPRGLPCVFSGGTCTAMTAYKAYYLTASGTGANGYWAVVAVSPEGRSRVYVWGGNGWQ